MERLKWLKENIGDGGIRVTKVEEITHPKRTRKAPRRKGQG